MTLQEFGGCFSRRVPAHPCRVAVHTVGVHGMDVQEKITPMRVCRKPIVLDTESEGLGLGFFQLI